MSSISKPNTFSANTTMSSSAVNANFDTIYNDYNGSISAANLASNAVTTAKITDANVTTAKIADNAITSAKIADNAITSAKIASLAVNTTTISNPYKFSAYRNAAQNTGNNAFAIINHDTELFDTNNNFDSVTNKGRYTAPVSGYYQFNAQASLNSSSADLLIALYKNGTVIAYGSRGKASTSQVFSNVSKLLQLTATDYVEVFAFCSTTTALEVAGGSIENYFTGFLVSQT